MIKLISSSTDKKIETKNLFFEMEYQDYLKFASKIIKNNGFQRKRVRSSSSIYSQLKNDMKVGCVIPPIVLALKEDLLDNKKNSEDIVISALSNSLILDGLQRTYTMIDVQNELIKSGEEMKDFLTQILRVEVYVGINKFGILYRMLTLNTGQTPMSLRHQIEILYGDYDTNIPGITLIKEVDGGSPKKVGEYVFKDTIEGFISYLQGDILPVTRSYVLETTKTLKSISKENMTNDLYVSFLECYNNFNIKLNDLLSKEDIAEFNKTLVSANDYDIAELEIDGIDEGYINSGANESKDYLFAKDILSLVTKAQLLSGFGGAIGSLKETNSLKSLEEVEKIIENITSGGENDYEWFSKMNEHLYFVKQNSKKIGTGQRLFFYYFFRGLFNSDMESYLNLNESIKYANKRYRADY